MIPRFVVAVFNLLTDIFNLGKVTSTFRALPHDTSCFKFEFFCFKKYHALLLSKCSTIVTDFNNEKKKVPKSNMENEICLRKLAQPLLGKWAVFIILTLENETLHFAELERRLKTISRKVLAQNLRELESINIISREGVASTGSPVYYGLTDLGKDFLPLLYQIKKWIRDHDDLLSRE